MPETILRSTFGFETFNPGQKRVIENVIEGRSSLAIFPTGAGKSLCYQISALMLPHLTLVVSPLLALMKDQLAFLTRYGIAAEKIDSTLTSEQHTHIRGAITRGETKILMVSVERFKNERFRQFIESVPISLLVIDEAHCISEWGHNFRPDYLKLPTYQKQLGSPPVLLLTATATATVKQDMARKFSIENSDIVQTGFYRANLDLRVEHVPDREKQRRCAHWLTDHQGAGIVYVTLQHQADQLADFLCRQGLSAVSYHAGLADELRQSIQQDFMQDKVRVVVATIAFGMGIDKSNIRFVVHYELPKSIESYSQEIGRAGRDGLPSVCLTLANLSGLTTLENFVYGDTPEPQAVRRLLQRVKEQSIAQRWETQVLRLANESNIRQLPLKTLLVQLELLGVIAPRFSYFAEYRLRFLQPKQQIVNQFDRHRQAFLEDVFASCVMKKVWGEVDFKLFESRQPGSRGRLISALEYLEQHGLIELQSKLHTDVFQVDQTALNQADLVQTLIDYVSQKEQAEIQRIQDMLGFFQSTSCLSANLAHYFDDQKAPAACGHCSVCQGHSITFEQPQYPAAPSVESLSSYIHKLRQAMESQLHAPLTEALCCRFLLGISSPFLTRIKARQISGYASCEHLPYKHTVDLIRPILTATMP